MFDTLLQLVRKSLLIKYKWQNPWKKTGTLPYNLSHQGGNPENRQVWVLILRGGDLKGSRRRWVYSISKSNGFGIMKVGFKSVPGYPSLLSGFGNTSYLLKSSFLVCKIVIIMSALQACEVHSTTLDSTEPNAKGIFVNINDNIRHVWKAMNYKIIAMKVPNVYHEEE